LVSLQTGLIGIFTAFYRLLNSDLHGEHFVKGGGIALAFSPEFLQNLFLD